VQLGLSEDLEIIRIRKNVVARKREKHLKRGDEDLCLATIQK
jgi:hypothetical protein